MSLNFMLTIYTPFKNPKENYVSVKSVETQNFGRDYI